MTQTTKLSIADRLMFVIGASVNDDGSPLVGKVADPNELFGDVAIGEKELKKSLDFEQLPAAWVKTVMIVSTAASQHHSFETLARNAKRALGRLRMVEERNVLEAQRPQLIAELAALGVTLRNERLPTEYVVEMLGHKKAERLQHCGGLLTLINRHREVLGEKAEEIGVTLESTGQELAARRTALDAMERAEATRVKSRLIAKGAHAARMEKYSRQLDRKRGIRTERDHQRRVAEAQAKASPPKKPAIDVGDAGTVAKTGTFVMAD